MSEIKRRAATVIKHLVSSENSDGEIVGAIANNIAMVAENLEEVESKVSLEDAEELLEQFPVEDISEIEERDAS